ncbi:MAG: acetate/propionate family kinase [Betaproteobacteria bacterium]|nr:acetate/propionate family kinase [Betaproteobacteria bacterium]
MGNPILVLNAGSSSLKFSVFVADEDAALLLKLRGQIEGIYTSPNFVAKDPADTPIGYRQWGEGARLGHEGALMHIVEFLTEQGIGAPAVVGHRVVHGGLAFSAPARITPVVLARLETYIPLAPLHQPHNLTPIRWLMERQPELPQIACFDTAFHRTQPEVAELYALPLKYAVEGIRRYGFHGLSYEYIASVLERYDERAARGKTIVLHLGNGASMSAMDAGKSVATTMGFTALDGLAMGTRCGSIDPGVLLYLMDQRGMDARSIEQLLYRESGMQGLSGVSSDMRVLLASEEPRARLAIDYYVYRIVREIGSLAAALGGLDALIFTGGIGENAAQIRARVIEACGWLGVELDMAANAQRASTISTPGSRVAALVIPTNEELMIARHCLNVLGAA